MTCPACQSKTALLRNLWILGAVLVVSLVLAVFFRPWMGAGTHPLLVRAELAEGARLSTVLDDGWTAPLVLSGDGFLTTELPPRSHYTLSLRAEGGAARLSGAWIMDLHVRPLGALHTFKPEAPIAAEAGASVPVAQNVPVTRGEFGAAFAAFFCLLLILAYGCVSLFAKGGGVVGGSGAGLGLWGWLIVAALGVVNVWLVATSTPIFWPADSIGYAAKALALYDRGEFYTNGIYFEITRAPGAPLVEALAFRLFGVSPGAVALLQALLYCGAAAFVLDGVARLGSRWVAFVAAPLVLLDPAAVNICRTFASEAPFVIVALCVSGCLLRSLEGRGAREWVWVSLAAVLAGCLVMVRPNGVIILAFPLFMLGRLFVRAFMDRTLPGLRRVSLHAVVVVVSLGTLLAWCWRNERVQGYFAPTDIVGLSAAEACFKSGILDVRASADDEAFYEDLVKARRATNYNFEAWALAERYRKRVEATGPVDKSAAGRVDLMEKEFAQRSTAASPVESRAARFARIFRWGLFLDKDPNYQPYGAPYQGFMIYGDEEWKNAMQIVSSWADPRFAVPQKPLGAAQRAFNWMMGGYKWGLIAVVSLALLFYARASWQVCLAPLVFLLPYFGNILLNAWLGVVVSRYVYVLEPFLFLGIAACVGQWLASRR